MSTGRITAIVIVALLHALLGYAFITGLAYNVIKKAAEDLKTFDVVEEPPPVVSPPPIVRVNTPPQTIQTVREAPPPIITPKAAPAPPAPPAPPPPPPPPPPPAQKVEPARARANLASYVSDADYPDSAIRAEESGTTGFRLEIGANGRVSNCTITSSSGSSALDNATCRIMRSRARFTPAQDSNGQPTTDTTSARITWRLPAD
jgi:protein TonB